MNNYIFDLSKFVYIKKIYFQRFFDIKFHTSYTQINWYKITKCGKLSDNFIEKYEKYIYFIILPKYQEISDKIREKYYEKFDKYVLNLYSDDNFLINHFNADFKKISEIPLSQKFIEKYWEKLDLQSVYKNNNFNKKFVIDFFSDKISIFNILSKKICNNKLDFIEKFVDKMKPNDWKIISFSQNLSEEFIEKYADKIDWNAISDVNNLSEKFIEKWQDKLDWYTLSYSQKLSDEFIKKYENLVDWNELSFSPINKLNEKFIIKNINKLNIRGLISRNKISDNLIERVYQFGSNTKYTKPYILDMQFIKDFKIFVKYLVDEIIPLEKHILKNFLLKYYNKNKYDTEQFLYKLNKQILDSELLQIINKISSNFKYKIPKNHPEINNNKWILENYKYLDLKYLIKKNIISNDIFLSINLSQKELFKILK